MTYNKKYITFLLLMTISFAVYAQNGINSPYSRYGFGVLSDRAMGFNKGMSGVAQGFRDGQSVNIQNPASYSEVDSMTALFDLGLTLQNGNYKMGNIQKNVRNTSFDYFAMNFRAVKNVGVSVGILPISNIKYSFSSASEHLEGTEDVTSSYNFNGDGGLHEVFLGAAWKPFKPISFGFNAAYLYGDYSHSLTMAFSDNSVYSLSREYTADIRTYNLDFGIQYIQPIGKNDKFVLGASYTLGHDVNNDAKRITQTLENGYIKSITTDSIKNAFQLPTSYAVGLTYYKSNKFRVGVDAELQKWSSCKFPNQQTSISPSDVNNSSQYLSSKGQLNDRKKISFGADYTPNMYSEKFFSHMTYRFGGFYSQSYANADATGIVTDKPIEYGLSAGVTIPIANQHIWRAKPKVNISVQWTHSSIPYLNTNTMKQANLSENYLRLSIGMTFAECWFFKYKVQ